MSDIVVLDEEAGKVVVASADGWVQMYDLAKKKREWDTRVFKVDQEDDSSPFSESDKRVPVAGRRHHRGWSAGDPADQDPSSSQYQSGSTNDEKGRSAIPPVT